MASTTTRPPLRTRAPMSRVQRAAMMRQTSLGSSSTKRPRSPEPEYTSSQAKRSKLPSKTAESYKKDKEERSQQKQEFKEKYTKAFPAWSFYFDRDNISMKKGQLETLITRIEGLGGHIDDFFSKEVTHLITDKPVPSTGSAKENRPGLRGLGPRATPRDVKSPVQTKSKGVDDSARSGEVVAKAISWGIKIWNAGKLDSVLCRCLDCPSVSLAPAPKAHAAPTLKLERLLSKEKHFGPGDRDPTQRRHDFRYFSKGSFFVLVEAMRGDVATIAAHEYPPLKDKAKPAWPILYLHPHSRGPFIEFDDKEKQRYERGLQKKLEEAKAPAEQKSRPRKLKEIESKQHWLNKSGKGFDLRRSVSLNNLKKKQNESPEALEQEFDGDDSFNSANASGFLVSGTPAYMAASGNSVGITSTTGTTSTAGGLRHSQLPAAIDLAMKRQILTSKKVSSTLKPEKRKGTMDPPSTIPVKGQIKKAKSMNFKPPKREEGSKPGYCECCRQKFDDFKSHVQGPRHRKFAQDDNNFLGLDVLLTRVRRRTKVEVEIQQGRRIEACRKRCHGLASSSPSELFFPSDTP